MEEKHKHYDEYVDLRNDGRIVMYKRSDHQKRPNWNVRLKIPNTKGYVVKSTKTKDFFEGRRISEELYYELEGKVRRGEVLKSPTFDKVVKEFIEESDYTFRNQSKTYKDGIIGICNNHLLPYYSKTPIDKITEDMMNSFLSSQYKNFQHSSVTQRHQQSVMKKVLEYGRMKGYLTELPKIPKPKLVVNNRSDFTKEEWKKLYEYMRNWVNHKNGRIHRQRLYTQQYILIMGNSGIRCGTESRNIKWGDISTTTDVLGEERVVISVDGKTNKRDVVCNVGIEIYLKRLFDYRKSELNRPPMSTEYVFVNPNGLPIKSFKGSFNSLLTSVGLMYDSEGKRRSPYSLRHTYITMRLMEGVNVYTLSSNCGTSVEMIENFYGHLRNRDPNIVSEITKNSFNKKQSSKIDFLINS